MQELVRTHQQQLQQLGFARQQIMQRQALWTGSTHLQVPEDKDPEVCGLVICAVGCVSHRMSGTEADARQPLAACLGLLECVQARFSQLPISFRT